MNLLAPGILLLQKGPFKIEIQRIEEAQGQHPKKQVRWLSIGRKGEVVKGDACDDIPHDRKETHESDEIGPSVESLSVKMGNEVKKKGHNNY